MKLPWTRPKDAARREPQTPADLTEGAPPGYVPTERLFPLWEKTLRVLYWTTPLILLGGGWLVYQNRAREFVKAEFPPATQLTPDGQLSTAPSLAADGRMAFASDRDSGRLAIWVADAGGQARRLTSGQWPETDPEFSPDGREIAYRSEEKGGGINVMASDGDGAPRRIADRGWRPRYSPDGKWIAYFEIEGEGSSYGYGRMFLVSRDGSTRKPVAAGFGFARHPVWVDNNTLLFEGTNEIGVSDWWVLPLDSNTPVRTGAFEVIREAIGRRGSPERFLNGRVLFSGAASGPEHIWDIELRKSDWQAVGPPRQLTQGPSGESRLAVAQDRIAYARLNHVVEVYALRFDTNQPISDARLEPLTKDGARALQPIVSASGARMLFVSDRTGTHDIWLKDLTGKQEDERLTVFRTIGFHPVLSADGQRVTVALASEEGCAIDIRSLNDTGEERVIEGCYHLWDVSPDGKNILVFRPDQSLKTVELLVEAGKTVPVIRHASNGTYAARFSPDGKWIAFTSGMTSGDAPVYVAPFRSGQVPESDWIGIPGTAGGTPAWSPDGQVLYVRSQKDGYPCLYAQRLTAAKRPEGEPIPVQHFHASGFGIGQLSQIEFYLSAARDKLVFNAARQTSTIWSSALPER